MAGGGEFERLHHALKEQTVDRVNGDASITVQLLYHDLVLLFSLLQLF